MTRRSLSMRRQEGQAFVEFVLVAPILLLLVFGIVQFGLLLHNYLTLTDAVRVGARQAAVSRTASNPTAATCARIQSSAQRLSIPCTDVTVRPFDPKTGTATWAQGGDVTVSASYPYSINLLGFVVKSGRLTSQTTERVE
jgi:Flp pilus assembly protein TadG